MANPSERLEGRETRILRADAAAGADAEETVRITAAAPRMRELLDQAAQAGSPDPGESTTILSSPPAAAAAAADLEETLGSIRALRDQGRAGDALRELNRAFQEHGPQPVLKTLRHELGEALLARDAEEEETASQMFQAFAVPTVEAAAPTAAEAAAPRLSARGLHDAQIRTASAAPRSTERPGPPVAPDHRGMLAVALALAAVFALLVWVLTREERASGPGTPPQPAAAAAVPPPGTLALDAVPWAEIVGLEQPGSEEPPPAPPSRFTPVILRLPPAEYVITLRYPPTGDEETLTIRVESGVRSDHRVTLGAELDGRQYFRRVGW